MADPNHFLFNSDYPTDKLVYLYKGEITITGRQNTMVIDTELPTLVYIDGDCYLEGETAVYPMDGYAAPAHANVASYMNNGKCYVYVNAFTSDTSLYGKKIYFRIWGYIDEAEAKNVDLWGTANVARPKLVITSDANYPRFVGDFHINPGQEYQHGLGVIPYFRSWMMQHTTLTLPDSTTVTADVYYPDIRAGYFGNPKNDDTMRADYLQVDDQKVKTFSGHSYITDGVYVRLYLI